MSYRSVSWLVLLCCVQAVLTLTLAPEAARATDFTWINPPGGDFGDSGNWMPITPPGPPGASDAAVFNLAYPQYTVAMDDSYTNDRLWVDVGEVAFDLQGETYTLTHDFFSDYVHSVEIGSNIGQTTNAKLTVINGTVASQHLLLSRYSTNTGELVVSSGAHWDSSDAFHSIGNEGIGRLTVEKGGRFDSFYMFMGGDGNARGSILVTDPGSLLNNPWFITAGRSGNAQADITIENGGTAQIGQLRMGETSEASATLLVDGSDSLCDLFFTPNSNESLIAGDAGTGSVTVQNGAGLLCSQDGFVGYQSGSSGSIVVQGTDSRMDVGQGLSVGHDGRGSLEVHDGASVTVGKSFNAAGYGDASGDLLVDGAGSRLLLSEGCSLGGTLDSGGSSNSHASLTISNGGYVNVGWDVNYGFNSASYVNGLVTGAGSTWDIDGSLLMGQFNGPTTFLTVSDGGLVSAANLQAACDVSAAATILVSGSGSRLVIRNSAILGGYDTSNPGGRAIVLITSGGSMQVAGITTILDTATLALDDGKFTCQGAMENQGEIRMLSDLSVLEGDALTNKGLLFGCGTVASVLENASDGEIRGQTEQRLLFTGASNMNYGEINLAGGTVEFSEDLTNQDGGFIGGRGELRVDNGFINEGVMAFSGGFTDVYGDVANNASGQIVVSGGGTTTFHDDVHTDGEIRVSSGCSAVFFGEFSGTGGTTGSGTVYLEGDLRPGNSPAEISFGGDLILGGSATLVIELAASESGGYDVVEVDNTLSLGGTLEVQLIDGFLPDAGNSFDILNWGELGPGTKFDTVNLPPLSYISWDDSQLYTTGILTVVVIDPLPGDANLDGQVDVSDLGILATNYGAGSGAVWSEGDFTGDGQVDVSDLGVLATHYGETASAASVPEPGILAFLLCGLSLTLLRRR